MRKLRRRPDSTAHKIATQLHNTQQAANIEHRTRAAAKRLHDHRPPIGTMVAQYVTPTTSKKLPPQSVTAAAEVVYSKSIIKAKKRPPVASWQKESWQLRKEIPEFRFAGDRVARGVSQYNLFAARRSDAASGTPERVTEGLPAELCGEMFGDIAATQQALHRAGQQLTFNGESLLVVTENENGLSWAAHSVTELTGQGRSFKLNNGVESRNLNDNDIVTRCWRPDPEFQGLADCAAQAVLPIARTLRGLSRRTGAEIDSRLAGAGILIFPDTVDVLSNETDEDGNRLDIMETLLEHMTIPIRDPDSAAAVVPLGIKVPADVVDKIKHISFATPLDEKLPDMETNAIRRVALGMDSPPETLLGMSSANHWTGWLISSEEVTLVLSPTVATICHALTTGWLQPMLAASGVEDATDYFVWFDASELELRPDKSVDSRELFNSGSLSEAAMLRENGFDETDAPTDDEKKTNLLTKLLVGAPSLAPLLLPMLGIEVDASVLQDTANITEATDGTTPQGVAPHDTDKKPPTGEQKPPDQPNTQPDDNTETGPGQ